MKMLSTIRHTGLFIVALLLVPDHAWALQPHGAPEGLYVHQMSHVLFTGALIYLYWHTRRTPELSNKGWHYLQLFCILFAGWNMLALVGHESARLLNPSDFIDKASWNEQVAGPITPIKMVYFITKMDHLLYVPALLALVIGLRSLSKDAQREADK
ncbi:hypothetical protein [Desulfogranum marinum]|jgi:hypothetical protein|uniref:hypothetical protein n=1 Tax=Desulfogranum marinum TaxID=453220 RepID=UPI001E3E91F2|nr:hypothetical protein [Desulfogranum marinum]